MSEYHAFTLTLGDNDGLPAADELRFEISHTTSPSGRRLAHAPPALVHVWVRETVDWDENFGLAPLTAAIDGGHQTSLRLDVALPGEGDQKITLEFSGLTMTKCDFTAGASDGHLGFEHCGIAERVEATAAGADEASYGPSEE